MRFALESQALSTAFTKNRIKLVINLKNIVKEMGKSTKKGYMKQYDFLDTKFHKLFFILSSNRYLLKHYESINGIIETIRTHTHNDKNNIIGSLNDHKIILDCIEIKSLSKAKKALDFHINAWIHDRVKNSRIVK